MRKQTQINSSKVIFQNGNVNNDAKYKNLPNKTSPEKTWRPLTHQQELQKKYEYEAWREKNL